MYHIKDDKRSRRSARLISETLLQCLREQDFSEITISQISQVSYVGRSTFYRLFDNLTDVLSYLCDEVTQDIETQLQVFPKLKDRERILLMLDRWMHEEVLLNTLLFHEHFELLFASFSHIFQSTMTHKPVFSGELVSHWDFLYEVLKQEIATMLRTWSINGKKETAAQMMDCLQEILSLQLHYL